MTLQVGQLVTPTGVLMLPADADRELWLAARRGEGVDIDAPIGSSDVPSILGVPLTRSADKVQADKMGLITDFPTTDAMELGSAYEHVTANLWQARNKSVVEKVGLISNRDAPWMTCSLDRIVRECPLNRRDKRACALEVKHRGVFGHRGWGKEFPDDILAQIMWQIIVTGFDHIHIVVAVGGNRLVQGVIRRDDVLAAYILNTVARWRAEYLLGDDPPLCPAEEDKAASHLELLALLYPERTGNTVVDVQFIGEVIELARLRAQHNALKKMVDRQKVIVERKAAGARTLIFADEAAAWFRPGNKAHVDLEKLIEKYPAAAGDPEVVTHKTTWSLQVAAAYKPGKNKINDGPSEEGGDFDDEPPD